MYDCFSAKCIDQGWWNKPRLLPGNYDIAQHELAVTEAIELFPQLAFGLFRVSRQLTFRGYVGRCGDAVAIGQAKGKTRALVLEAGVDRNPPCRRGLGQRLFPGMVAVPADQQTAMQAGQFGDGSIGVNAPAGVVERLRTVDLKAHDLALVHVSHPVTIGRRLADVQLEPLRPDASNRPEWQTDKSGAVKRPNVGLAAVRKIVGCAAVEGLFGIGQEGELRAAAR